MEHGHPTNTNNVVTDYPEPLAAREAALIATRRNAVLGSHAAFASVRAQAAIGVGLSGGGIRSATFCLGVFQSLARTELLRQVDYVSTVSGGGYFGGFLGRLFARPLAAEKAQRADEKAAPASRATHVEQVLRGEVEPGVLRALRSNGRYIAPSGGGDLLLLAAVLLRNWLAILTVLVVSLFAALAWIEALRSSAAISDGFEWWESTLNQPQGFAAGRMYWSGLLVLPLPLAFLALCLGTAYWVPRSRAWFAGCAAALVALLAYAALAFEVRGAAWIGGLALLLAMVWLVLIVAKREAEHFRSGRSARASSAQRSEHGTGQATSDLQVDSKVRSLLSRRFTWIVCACAISIAISLIDSIGRTIYALIQLGQFDSWWSWLAGGIAGMFGGGYAARIFAVVFAKRPSESRPALSTSMLAAVAAAVVALFLVISSSVAVQALTWQFDLPDGAARLDLHDDTDISWLSQAQPDGSVLEVHETRRGARDPQPAAATPLDERMIHGLLAIAWACGLSFLAWLMGWSRNFLLLSSHHPIYSARLTRAYLGASNPERMGGHNDMTEVLKGDDIALSDYYPKSVADSNSPIARGAPLHFINVTVNETVDGETKLQQQDRRGVGLALGPCGLSLGIRHHSMFWWQDVECESQGKPKDKLGLPSIEAATGCKPTRHQVFDKDGEQKPEMLSLGRWISLSGAAFSTGIGSRTSLAMSLLAGVFNVRLGHWWDPGLKRATRIVDSFIVQRYLCREIFARFPGTAKRFWYLTDGGHFENMGGYELIRRKLRKILIVDAEADPDYTFGGLSDLVRKARLDFDAEITFLDHAQLDTLVAEEYRAYFGTLDDLRRLESNSRSPDRTGASRAYAALARVSFGKNPQDDGVLLYIKPTLIGQESADLQQYHAVHSDFPQETTVDQFFDEAQWESYRKLGSHIGEMLFAVPRTQTGKFVPRDLLDWHAPVPWLKAQPDDCTMQALRDSG